MKTCIMCGTEREDVSMVQAAPATWNGFHNYAEVCAECQNSRRFKMWAKSKQARSSPPADGGGGAAVPVEPAAKGSRPPATVQIAHRRTGALLHVVENHTLVGASLSGATLSGADLQHAAMRGADLHQADLRLADLTGADLRGADLRGVNLRGADLRGADLREARMHRSDVSHALYDGGTRWPAGFDPAASGAQRDARGG